jgi:hypothetical protein
MLLEITADALAVAIAEPAATTFNVPVTLTDPAPLTALPAFKVDVPEKTTCVRTAQTLQKYLAIHVDDAKTNHTKRCDRHDRTRLCTNQHFPMRSRKSTEHKSRANTKHAIGC